MQSIYRPVKTHFAVPPVKIPLEQIDHWSGNRAHFNLKRNTRLFLSARYCGLEFIAFSIPDSFKYTKKNLIKIACRIEVVVV